MTQSTQARILTALEGFFSERGYSTSRSMSYSNMGTLFIYSSPRETVAFASIDFDFQHGTYKLSITWQGTRIPSQVGRADYFDFYQRYDEDCRIWAALRALVRKVPKLKGDKELALKVCHEMISGGLSGFEPRTAESAQWQIDQARRAVGIDA